VVYEIDFAKGSPSSTEQMKDGHIVGIKFLGEPSGEILVELIKATILA